MVVKSSKNISHKYKICVICVYFGEVPEYFELWEKSCTFNSWIDFILVTDQNIKLKHNNIKVINMTLNKFKRIIEKKINMNVKLSTPYKCCDYKPIYGIVFDEYIKQYDFWGHCDLDVVFGDLGRFLTDDIFSKYDKIYPLGHLTFYRNSEECLERYKIDIGQYATYKKTFSSDKIFVFDEFCGMHQIYVNKKFPYYMRYEMADITPVRKRFTLSAEKYIGIYDMCDIEKFINYNKQIFYREDGSIYRAYINEDGDIKKDEYSYIHIKGRKLKSISGTYDMENFFLLPEGFLIKENKGLPTYDEFNKYNIFKDTKSEKLEERKYKRKVKLKKIKKRVGLYIREGK